MKQLLLGGRIHVEDVPVPGLGSGEVLVEVAYSFVSTGTEIAGVKNAGKTLIGKIKDHPQRVTQVLGMVRVNGIRKTLSRVNQKLDSRSPLGYSAAGRVIAVGASVTRFAPGDLVACGGQRYACHAEVVSVPANLVAKVPDECDLKSASGATVASIALQGVRRADPRLGETVVVVGLGLLGQITLQILAANGARAIGFDPNPKRVEEARALECGHCHALVGDAVTAIVNGLTNQMGADATIITAATTVPGICQNAMEMTRRKGKVVVVGAVPLTFERDPFYRKEIDFLISSSYGPGRYDSSYEEGGRDYPYAYVRWTENRNMQAVLRLIAEDRLRLLPLVAHEYPVDRADDAFASLNVNSADRPLAVVFKYDWSDQINQSKMDSVVRLPHPRPVVKGKIGVGIIGTGQFCRKEHLPNLAMLSDQFQITAVCDKVGSTAHDIARQYGARIACTDVQELVVCDDVSLVLIATRHNTHAEFAIRALEAGKHVFVEKPMAMNVEEMNSLVHVIRH